MPRSASAEFVADNGIFIRDDYAAAVGRQVDDSEVSAMLAEHVKADDIREFAPGVFTSVVYHSDPDKPSPDPFLEAVRLRPDAVIAYYSVFDLLGSAYAPGHLIEAISPGPPATIESGDYIYRFTSPPPGLPLQGDGPDPEGVETVPYMGLEIRLTTLERTVVDLFADPDKAPDTIFETLCAGDVDPAAVVRHARAVGDAGAAAALGFWLESERKRSGVDDATLAELRALAPRRLQYAMGAGPGVGDDGREAMLGAGWNVILPAQLVRPLFQGDDLEEFAAWCRGRA